MANLVLSLAESVKSAGVRSVYGDPIEMDDVTVIPVAFAQFGFGGGQGPDQGDEALNGGGGGGFSVPVGAYIKDRTGLRFEPNPISLLVVAIPFVWVVSRGLVLIIRAMKKRRH